MLLLLCINLDIKLINYSYLNDYIFGNREIDVGTIIGYGWWDDDEDSDYAEDVLFLFIRAD